MSLEDKKEFYTVSGLGIIFIGLLVTAVSHLKRLEDITIMILQLKQMENFPPVSK